MAQTTRTVAQPLPGIASYLAHFKSFEQSLNGGSSSELHAIRRSAIRSFAETGFPTTRNEEWKYTDVSSIAKTDFAPLANFSSNVTHDDVRRLAFGKFESHRLVFVNGIFSKSLSTAATLPRGIEVGSLADAIRANSDIVNKHLAKYAEYKSSAFTALSTAFVQDGACIVIPDGTILEIPVQLLFISTKESTGCVTHPRNLIVAGKNSQVTIIENYVGVERNNYFTNTVSEYVVGENAIVESTKLQSESDKAFHIGTTRVEMTRSSNFTSNAINFGGALVRNNIVAVLDGEGAECTLNGLYLATGNQHIDNHTTIDHAKPHCPSHELYKGILSGKSKGVFNGKIKVRKDAQKTDAKQTNKNLILSDEASIDTKPQLEIYANDVKCTHGATIGQLEDEQMFYLRSRGVDVDAARDMLIYAFASDVVDRIKLEPVRAFLHQTIHDRLITDRQ